ncbi:MAG: pectate lyase [Acidobacteriota bacterium]
MKAIQAFLGTLLWMGSVLMISQYALLEVRAAQESCFRCTQVIGYSQVGSTAGRHYGWYVADGVFESIVEDGKWQLLWHGGGGVDRWRQADYVGWEREIISPCSSDSERPDRVVLSVSGPYGQDEAAWAEAIEASVNIIIAKLPSVRQIVLEPVVGGPGGQPCPCVRNCRERDRVRASWQYRHIDNAIRAVTTRRSGVPVQVIAGFSPQVRSCDDYFDGLGHLMPEAAAAVARKLGEYYAGLDCGPTAAASQMGVPPSKEEVLRGLKRAARFYSREVATQGGYHFYYTDDLSYGRSESAEGATQVEIQRQGTLVVGMSYLWAYEATGDRFYLEAARQAARALVKGQLCSGGWEAFIEFDPRKREQYRYRVDGSCEPAAGETRTNTTSLDDNKTQGALRLLMRVDREFGFQDSEIHEAARYALDQLILAQYPNGAWPQRFDRFPDPAQFPVKKASYPESWSRRWPGPDYGSHYTFNDNSIADMIDTFLEAVRIYGDERFRAAAEKGGDFILLAQMPDPQPGWAQQYDRNMHPAWARRFEPPAITGGEAQGVMKILLVLYRETGNRKYLEPLGRALPYYRRSVLPDVESPSEIRSRACPPGTVYCLARFYELETNRPLYITKGNRVNVAGQSGSIMDGYELSYSDESVITHYSVLVRGDELDRVSREYEELSKADPSQIRRPDRLSGLSPWSSDAVPIGSGSRAGAILSGPGSGEELAARARPILDGMDERGAWVEEGTIGRQDRIVSVFVAEDMVVTLGDQSFPMRENDTLQIFKGMQAPRQRIISSQTFARNVETLAAYLKALESEE